MALIGAQSSCVARAAGLSSSQVPEMMPEPPPMSRIETSPASAIPRASAAISVAGTDDAASAVTSASQCGLSATSTTEVDSGPCGAHHLGQVREGAHVAHLELGEAGQAGRQVVHQVGGRLLGVVVLAAAPLDEVQADQSVEQGLGAADGQLGAGGQGVDRTGTVLNVREQRVLRRGPHDAGGPVARDEPQHPIGVGTAVGHAAPPLLSCSTGDVVGGTAEPS